MIKWLKHSFKSSEVTVYMSIKKSVCVFLSAVVVTTGLFAFNAAAASEQSNQHIEAHTTNAEMQMAGIRLQT